MRPIANLLKVGKKTWWTPAHSAVVEHVSKQLSVNTKLLLPDVARFFVLEVEYMNKGLRGVLLKKCMRIKSLIPIMFARKNVSLMCLFWREICVQFNIISADLESI